MNRRVRQIMLCLAAMSLGGCARTPVTWDPNPPPPPGYTVVCQSAPGLFFYHTACEPTIVPTTVVVRARG